MKQWRIISALAIVLVILVSGIIIAASSTKQQETPKQPDTPKSSLPQYTYSIVNTYPHDTKAFTEGLTYVDGQLYESTGGYGSSTLRKVDLETGNIVEEVTLPNQFFGEGIAVVNNTIIQLTYREMIGFIFDKDSLEQISDFTYGTEGWGFTFDGNRLIMSNGTSNLNFLDPVTLRNIGHVAVHDGNVSVTLLNELEYVKGDVYANIFMQQRIAVIDPETGQVKAWINLAGLDNSSALNAESVLNGIAYDSTNDRLFVTGKNWPHLYEIKLVLVS
jgi:glutamine cyclotransferase